MSVFLTGVTGYVGKHLLRYFLSTTSRHIVVCIRDKSGTSGKDRFQNEICNHPLFRDLVIQANLKNVRVVEKDVSALKASDISECIDVIHCAANVKFTSPINLLLAENVIALKRLYRLCKQKRFYHISTCYVHPKTTPGPYESIKIESGLERSEFICNYAYTKYLAEQYLYKQKGCIDIIRLSCVGAPLDDLYPIRGGAHLSALEALERSIIPDIWCPKNLQFSVVPVDSICKAIIDRTKIIHDGLQVVQYSAPANSPTYNISGLELLEKKVYPKTKIWGNVSYEQFTAWIYFFYWFFPHIAKRILDVNIATSYVSSNQLFQSDLDLPEISPDEYIKITLSYIEKLVKLNPKHTNLFMSLGLYLLSFVKWAVLKLLGDDWISSYED
jgi:nucleoside-diphosphate-sugar epimerase